jgi:DNA mismatch repair protein MutS
LFDQQMLPEEPADEPTPDILRDRVDQADPDSLTPREALALLYELKDLL